MRVPLGNGVEPVAAPRVTAGDATSRQPQSAPDAMTFDGHGGVGGAGGLVAARGGAALTSALVEADGRQEGSAQGGHVVACRMRWQSSVSEVTTSSYDASPTPGPAPTRKYPAGRPTAACPASTTRQRRRSRLRATALPTVRAKANATRGGVARGSSTQFTQSRPWRNRRPSDRNRANDARSSIRQIRPTAAAGPWPDGTSARHDQRGSTCDDESRASWHACDCSVGRYASPNASWDTRQRRGPRPCNNERRRDATGANQRPRLGGRGHRRQPERNIDDQHEPGRAPAQARAAPASPSPAVSGLSTGVVGSAAPARRGPSAGTMVVHRMWTGLWTIGTESCGRRW